MKWAAAVVALCAAGLVILNEYRWRKKDNRHLSFRAVVISVLILLGLSLGAHARPSPYPPVTQFNGDKYDARAQLGPEVVKSAKAKQGAKARKKPKVRVKHVPGMVARLSLPEGIAREAVRVVGRPAAWCGWWLGQHLGMPLRKLWLARNWAHVGSPASPAVGVVVVWAHHVGIITGRRGNQWVVKSGNDGRAVRERPRSVAGAIAFRRV